MNTPVTSVVGTRTKFIVLIGIWLALAGCANSTSFAPTPSPLAAELVLYNWAEYMPQSVLDAFANEYGVKVNYVAYSMPEEVVQTIASDTSYDVVVLPPEFIPELITDNRLAKIDYCQTYLCDLADIPVQTYRQQAQGVAIDADAESMLLDLDMSFPGSCLSMNWSPMRSNLLFQTGATVRSASSLAGRMHRPASD